MSLSMSMSMSVSISMSVSMFVYMFLSMSVFMVELAGPRESNGIGTVTSSQEVRPPEAPTTSTTTQATAGTLELL